MNTVSWDKNGHLCVAGILKIYILPKQRSGGKNKWVKVGAMIVAATKILDAIDVVDLQIHEDKLMWSGIKDRMVLCRTQGVG